MIKLFIIFFMSLSLKATYYKDLSTLERDVVDEGLKAFNVQPVEDAQGKTIGKIFIYTKSPFSKEAGFLSLLDGLHVTTKDYIVSQELTFKAGAVFDPAFIRDSEIILRDQDLVRSLAVIVPVCAHGQENTAEIDLLVATRDLFSLTPSFSFNGSGTILDNFSVGLGEYNLFGYAKAIAVKYSLSQASHSLGASYVDPRLLGSKLQLSLKPSFLFNRDDFVFNGYLGEISFGLPLRSIKDKWAFSINSDFGSKLVIDFNGDKVRTFDIPETAAVEALERRYRYRYGNGSITGTRSFGTLVKNEISLGYGLRIKRPAIESTVELSEEEINAYKKYVLPKDELESYISLGYSHFHNKYLVLYDYDNFRLQETVRLGPRLSLGSDFASKNILLSDNNFVRPNLSFGFTHSIFKDSFMYFSASTRNRYDGDFNDISHKLGLSYVSPKLFGVFRTVLMGLLSLSYDNRDNQKFTLGADSGLRGVTSRFYSGSKAFRFNAELRSSPLKVWIFYLGGVAFYDVGAAFDKWSEANATHDLGFGIRMLAPQVSSEVFRLDLAFPIYGRGKREHVVVPSFGLGQAF